MDPLSITVACVALLTAIQEVSKSLLEFVREVRGARKEIDGFYRELNSIQLCVEALANDEIPFPSALKEQLATVVANCDAVIREMLAIIIRHRRKRQSSSSSGPSIRTTIQWTSLDAAEIRRSRERLESYKMTMDITLDMASLLVTGEIKADTTMIREDTGAIRAEVVQLRQQVPGRRLQSTRDANPLLARFLDDTATYAESVVDPLELQTAPEDTDDELGSSAPVVEGAVQDLNHEAPPQAQPSRLQRPMSRCQSRPKALHGPQGLQICRTSSHKARVHPTYSLSQSHQA
jgi:hypothetical protein